MSTITKAKATLSRWLDKGTPKRTPKNIEATFVLRYGSLPVGMLSVCDGVWRFEYSPEFKKRSDLRPIVEFPDLDRVYESEDLWPFFAVRVPSLEQPAIRNIARHEAIDVSSEVQLLRRFGRRTVSNPFVLDPC